MTMEKDAVLLMSHFMNGLVAERYKKLRTELPQGKYDVRLLLNMDALASKNLGEIPFAVYSIEQLNALEYTPICETVLPGSCHFSLLAFYKEHPTYRYYWLVEYDVYFTGRWSFLFDAFEHATSDFLSCGLEKYDESKNENWPWWRFHNEAGYPLEKCLKSFNPICRLSNKALEYLDSYLRRGFSAHSEVMIPTALYNAGYRLEDFGGDGGFVSSANRNKFYSRGEGSTIETMRWRPVFEGIHGFPSNKIVHPIKVEVSPNHIAMPKVGNEIN